MFKIITSRSSMFNSRVCSRPVISSLCCFMLKDSLGFFKIPIPSLLLLITLKTHFPYSFVFPPQNVFPVANVLNIVSILQSEK